MSSPTEIVALYEVGIVTRFEASHSLEGDFGPARELHSHNYRVGVTVGGTDLRDDGTLIDIEMLSAAAEKAVGEMAGKKLNDLPAFEDKNSTAEAVCKFLFDRIASHLLAAAAEVLRVEVWESDEAFASYESRLGHPTGTNGN